ncbi:MAG: thiamine pyrophosphate-binding protein [Rubrivivax sp.]
MAALTGGAFIAQTLQAYGVDHVFFVDAILRRALIEMEPLGIRRVLTHSEKAAAYMADGYARAGNRPGVCMAQSVGAANLAAGLQDAWLGQSPVIAITGRQVAANQYRNAYQEIPHEPLYAAVTRQSLRADTVEQLPLLLRAAFRGCTAATPRPVHLDIGGHTGDVVGAASLQAEVACDPPFRAVPAFRPAAPPQALARVRALLAQAQRPVAMVGRAAMVSGVGEVLDTWCRQHGVAVVASLDAKAVLVDDHPCFAGVAGTYSRACANQVLEAADLVLMIGTDTSDQATAGWTLPGAAAALVQVDADPLELGRNFARAELVQADPRTFLEQLAAEAGPEAGGDASGSRPAWRAEVAGLVAAWRAQATRWCADDARPIRPAWLCGSLSRLLPPDALLLADTGYASQWAGTLVALRHPGQRFLRAAGSLGWAFPAALGARCALPATPVVCFTGDGGFMYHAAELETARRCGIRTVTVVNNNSQLAQGVPNIDKVYEGRDASRKHEIHAFRDMDFARLAQAHDCLGLRVEHPSQFEHAFQAALASELPAVIDVVTDPASRPISGGPARAS